MIPPQDESQRRAPDNGSGQAVPGVVVIDHIADIGIDVRADSRADLFSRAAAGMTSLMLDSPVDGPPHSLTVSRRIELEASDAAGLLVAWLRELLYLYMTQDFIYGDANFLELDDRRLRALVRGVSSDDTGTREIKGVTYHGLDVTCRDGEWRARIIFDV